MSNCDTCGVLLNSALLEITQCRSCLDDVVMEMWEEATERSNSDPNHCPQRYEDIQVCKDTSCVCLPYLLATPRNCEDCGVPKVHYSWMGAYCKECLQTGSGLFE